MLQAACAPFAFDGAEDAALLVGDEDTKRIGGIVVATLNPYFEIRAALDFVPSVAFR